MARPGKTLIHHAMRITERPEPMRKPQDIRFGSPSPRKDSEDSSRMAVAAISEASTMTDDSALGRISVRTIDRGPLPRTSAAWTNSRARRLRNSARTTRVTGGQDTTAMAATMEPIEGVKIATSRIASTKEGIVWKNSVIRMTRSSTQPPR